MEIEIGQLWRHRHQAESLEVLRVQAAPDDGGITYVVRILTEGKDEGVERVVDADFIERFFDVPLGKWTRKDGTATAAATRKHTTMTTAQDVHRWMTEEALKDPYGKGSSRTTVSLSELRTIATPEALRDAIEQGLLITWDPALRRANVDELGPGVRFVPNATQIG